MAPKQDSEFEYHGPCENCSSSDGVSWWSDGHGFCHVCEKYYPSHKERHEKLPDEQNTAVSPDLEAEPRNGTSSLTPVTDVFRGIPKRGLAEADIKKYQIDVCMDKDSTVGHRYPYYKAGVHVANKVRKRGEKAFYWEGDPRNVELFGQHLFPADSANSITIVEGELDAPSAWKLTGSRYPVVSVPSAGHAIKAVKTNYEYLNAFKEIVICFDNDKAGQDRAVKVAELFRPGKCRVLFLQQGKDPNEYLQKGIDPRKFVSEWWAAAKYTPVGLKIGKEMWEEITNRPSHFAIDYPWEGLNSKTYGMRLSEAVLWMADTGVGKTSFFKEMEHAILTNPTVIEKGYGVGILHLEEPNFDTALGLMSIEANKPFHLPDTPKTNDELRVAYDAVLNNDRAIFYDHFGSNDIDEILAKVRHMAVMGCKYIFIDHLSIIVSDQSGDERKQLDEISTKLKMLTMELDICVHCVIHTNRDGQARGSAGPEKVANIHLALHRDKDDPDTWRRNVTKVSIVKNRFCGRTGPAVWLFYDEGTGRLIELSDEAAKIHESGGSINDSDLSF